MHQDHEDRQPEDWPAEEARDAHRVRGRHDGKEGSTMRSSKYNAVKTEVDGIVFDSKLEAKRYSELKMLLRSGIISDLELQKKFELRVNGVLICKYVADFYYLDQSGRQVVEDVKGVRNPVYSIKAKLMIACHGLRILETQWANMNH